MNAVSLGVHIHGGGLRRCSLLSLSGAFTIAAGDLYQKHCAGQQNETQSDFANFRELRELFALKPKRIHRQSPALALFLN
jgi:hypothetical protein